METLNVLPAFNRHHPKLTHGISTRQGGISPAPFNGLNISFGVGDQPDNVYENREKIKKHLGINRLVSAKQIHSDKVLSITEFPESDLELDGYDALITSVYGIGIMIQQADCQAVMLFDQKNLVTANIHSGWKGSVANIIVKTVKQMTGDFGSNPTNIHAAISPSLGPCCAEFINHSSELPKQFLTYQMQPNYFDFWSISRDQLISTGIKAENIHKSKICTMCDERFFSYRRSKETGRFASIIGLK